MSFETRTSPVLAIAASALVHTSGILVRPLGQIGVRELSPYVFLTFRVALSALGLVIFGLVTGQLQRVDRETLTFIALFSVVDLILAKWLFFISINDVSVVTSATITSVLPCLLSFGLDVIRKSDSATNAKASFGVLLGTGGSLAVVYESLFADPRALDGPQTSTPLGVATCFLSVLLGTAAMLSKAHMSKSLDYYLLSAWTSIVGATILATTGVLAGWVDWHAVEVLNNDRQVIAALVVYAVYTASMSPMTLWCMANAGATLFTLVKTMQPSLGALVAYLLLGENISARQAVSVLLSCAGLAIYVNNKQANTKTKNA